MFLKVVSDVRVCAMILAAKLILVTRCTVSIQIPNPLYIRSDEMAIEGERLMEM